MYMPTIQSKKFWLFALNIACPAIKEGATTKTINEVVTCTNEPTEPDGLVSKNAGFYCFLPFSSYLVGWAVSTLIKE